MAKIRPEVVWWFQYSRNSNILRLFSLLICIITVVHYMTCMFFPVMEDVWFSRADCEQYDLAEYTELIRTGVYDGNTFEEGLPMQSCATNSSTNDARYATAFYNSMLLIQGEHIDPISVEEKFYCSGLILVGSIVLAVIFGNVSMYIANFSANSTAYQRKVRIVRIVDASRTYNTTHLVT